MEHRLFAPSPGGPTGSRPRRSSLRRWAVALTLATGGLALTGCGDGVGEPAGAAVGARMQQAAAPTSEAAQPGGGITVMGEGTIGIAPDRLVADLGVEVRAGTPGEALDKASTQAQALIDALTGAGVAEQDIRTVEVALRPDQPRPDQPGPDQATEFVATNIVRAEITQLDRAGAILDGAVNAGGDAAVIRSVQFTAEDPPLDEARAAAWQDAVAKAQQLASLAGVTLGPAVSINETGIGSGPVSVARDAVAVESVPLQPGRIMSRVNLEVRFEIVR